MNRPAKYIIHGLIGLALLAVVAVALFYMRDDNPFSSRNRPVTIAFLLCFFIAAVRLSLIVAHVLSHIKSGKPLRPHLRGFNFANRASHYIDRRQKARRERVARTKAGMTGKEENHHSGPDN